MMKRDSYKELVKFLNDKAINLLIKKGEVHAHAFLVRDKNEAGIEIVMVPFDPETAVNDLSPIAKEFKPECIVTITEAWASANFDGVMPSEQSDKREVLFVNSEHIEHGLVVVTSEISRTEKGKIKSVKPDPISEKVDGVSGRLSNLLSKCNASGNFSNIKRHPGYKSHFKSGEYTIH